MDPKEYKCSCQAKCGGLLQIVTRYKYYKHRQYRAEGATTPLPSILNASLSYASAVAAGPSLTQAPQSQPTGEQRFNDVSSDTTDNNIEEDNAAFNDPILTPRTPYQPQYNDSLESSIGSSKIPDLQTSLDFRRALEGASLQNGDLDPRQLHNLQHPRSRDLRELDRDVLMSLRLFLSTTSSSDVVYENVRQDIQADDPERKLLSHKAVKREIAQLTGVEPMVHDMCPQSCMAYTGPFSLLESCNYCQTSRLDPVTQLPRQMFYTMPIGPQLQARWSHPQTAHLMEHRRRETEKILKELRSPTSDGKIPVYGDIYHGREYLQAVHRGDIKPDDMTLMFSMDGAQLYEDKKSDCWIYIWVLLDLPPDIRYKQRHVIPGAVIPGPNNPKHMDSFLFPGFHHLAAIQKDGLMVYHGVKQTTFVSNPYLLLGSADGPGSTHFTGFVGHHGHHLCRLYCGLEGRHKPFKSAYYCSLLKPKDYLHASGGHADIKASLVRDPNPVIYQANLLKLIASQNNNQYQANRKMTGLSSLTIFSGLPSNRRLPIPTGFAGDCMHVANLNLGDLLIPLWRGSFHCDDSDDVATWDWAVLTGQTWKDHGAAVARCRSYLPGCYDRPPRDLSEKVSSGYKAKEWQNYYYGLAPALLYGILPDVHWKNFCKLVYAMRILHQKNITLKQLQEAHQFMAAFHEEFETLYCQRRLDRIHFMRPCLHALLHMASETARLGPVTLSSTWTMERAIGYLGSQIRQPSNPYRNLSERGLRQCQVNSLLVAFPQLEHEKTSVPQYGEELGEGYIFLRARERTPRMHRDEVGKVVRKYFMDEEAAHGNVVPETWQGPKIRRWARLQLPNGQVARSAWKESLKPVERVRQARMVKLKLNEQIEFAEVQFYFYGIVNDIRRALAVVWLFSGRDEDLFRDSSYTVWSVTKLTEAAGLRVVEVKSIVSVVAVVPHTINAGKANEDNRLFIWEQFGMEMSLWSEALVNPRDIADEEDVENDTP